MRCFLSLLVVFGIGGCFHSSIDKAERACAKWKGKGVILTFTRPGTWAEIGLKSKPGLKPKPVEESISSRKCVMNEARREVEGRKNNEIRLKRWIEGKNEGRWLVVRKFRY